MINVKGGQSLQAKHASSAMGKAVGGFMKKAINTDFRPPADPYEKISIQAGKSYVQEDDNKAEGAKKKKDDLKDGELPKPSADNDSDFEFSDDEGAIQRIHEARLAQLKKQGGLMLKYKSQGHGSYTNIREDEFLPSVTGSKLVVCHFYHKEFERCKIMDKHLQILAQKYIPVRFVHIDAEKSPFFVDKLKIQMLPTVVLFRDGIAVDRIVGFEALGGSDDFATKDLEELMKKAKILRSLSRDGEEIEGDEEDEERRKLQANLRKSNRGHVQEDDEEY